MKNLESQVESLLFVESKPLTFKKIAKVCESSEPEVENILKTLQRSYDERQGGVTLVVEGNTAQLMTAATQSDFIREYVQAEQTPELTRPSLETLTIIAYRGPVSKSEIELIRGVNCSLILRNLMIRGLAEEDGETESGSPIYRVTIDFLRILGLNKTSDLPNYEDLNANVHLQELLERSRDPEDFFQRPEAPSLDTEQS